MAIKITVDGKVYTDVDTITVGGKVLTLAYVESSTGGGSGGSGDVGNEVENNGWIDGEAYAIEWTDGYLLDIGTGVVTENENFAISNFLPVEGVSAIETNSKVYSNYLYAYDADQNYLGRINRFNDTPISINNGVSYIRISARLNDKAVAAVTPRLLETLGENTAWEADKYYTVPHKNEGMALNASTGVAETKAAYATSGYVFCYGASTVNVEGNLAKADWRKTVVFYDSDKNYISGTTGNDSPYTVPENAMYFRVCGINGFEYTIQKPNNPWVKLA